MLYAKSGAAVTLTVTTTDTACVDVAGAFTGHQTSATTKTSWTFITTAGSGDSAQAVTVSASEKFNGQGNCAGNSAAPQASYTLDNTGPVVTAALTPAANAAGWNNTNTTVNWAAADAGSGVASGPTPVSSTESANGIVTRTSTATDRLGNAGSGSVTVRVDKAAPTITAAQTQNADGTTTVTFTCLDDAVSGIASCVADGTSPASNSKTVGGNVTVTGTAIDVAGNTSTASSTTPPSDGTPPTITHAVSPAPNADGWNKADATVTFTCADNTGGSGMKTCLADGTTSASKTVSTETNGTLVGGTATDNAGNTAKDSVTVKLDKTAPAATATRSVSANANGWNNTDVTVSFSGTDPLSGVASKTADKVLGEGANQSASGIVTDAAGNTSATASVTGVNVDTTAPVLTGSFSSGWHTGDVTVAWTCTDALSGPSGQPADTTVTGEGDNLSATATCTDKAGNTTTKTVSGIQIDRTAPTTGISGTSNNWVNGAATVSLTATDNMSGVASTKYTVDGGSTQTGTSLTLSTEGDHTLTFYSTDNAGNVEAVQTAHVKIDMTAPTISHAFTPLSYADGAWTNQDVTVTFTCADQGGSGVASCTDPITRSAEGSYTVTGTATDGAANSATDSASVRIDKTAPTITATAGGTKNAAGWYKDDVTVTYSASDNTDGSGIAGSPAADVLHEGANQSASATVTDAAGNRSTAGVTGINVDTTDPVLTGSFSSGWHTGDVTVNWTCTDELSGPTAQPADGIVTGEGENLSATATCTDRAGNSTTKTVSGIQIDRIAPATVISVSGESHNGWYQAGIELDVTASDNLSGVDKTYYSVDGGTAQLYSAAVSIAADGVHTFTYWSTDKAGNVEDKAGNSVTLKIDKTAPTLTGAFTGGWHTSDVTVNWTCSDATSGIDGTCPADSTVTGEGDNLTAAASLSDVAGNSTNKTVDGIKIDRTDPTTQAEVAAPNGNNWYGAAVDVKLVANDNLSGVAKTFYKVDGGTTQTYGDTAFSFGTEGTHTISFWSVDAAGNTETAGAPITLNIDKTAPSTTVINPISPDSGWFVTSGIPVAFDANDSGSGIAATYYTIDGGARHTYGVPFTANLSTGTHTITYWSVDLADNEEALDTTNTIPVNVDTIAPTITGTRTPAANSFGWNNSDVAVTFQCADADSGIDGVVGCGPDQTVASEGPNQHVQGDAQDIAGNKSSTTVDEISIDKTAPSLVGATTGDANGGEWYRSNVSVAWTGDDGLSGIDPGTQPANSTINSEGRNLGASASIFDKAGNKGTGSVDKISIDKTAPSVTGVLPGGKNAAGWYRGDVIVGFTCADAALADGSAGSGVANCPADALASGDGANQSVTSAAATDVAGNTSAGKTVSGINIDGHEPQTTADNQCTATNGYCTGDTATVILGSTDVGPSGVKEIRYTVNSGTEQVAAGSSKSVSVPLSGTGAATVKYYAVDVAGNTEPTNQVTLKYDNIAPTVTHTVNPTANAADWNNSNVTVHFDAKDTDPGSGVLSGSVTADQVVSNETTTSGLVVNGSAKDTAGNTGTDSVTVRLDKTAPIINGAITSGTLGNSGWYVSPVSVKYTCSDALSGIAVCPDDENIVLSNNGANQSVARTAKDVADNSGSATVSGINIDNENPSITDVNVANGFYTLGAAKAATCTATDSFSGLLSCKVVVSGGTNGVGTFNWTATATDKAGNTKTQIGTYKVVYKFDGFLQPINDTAHQTGLTTSVFKGGSTIPVKFQLKNAAGTAVQSATAPIWLTPVKGVAMSMPVCETAVTVSADSGSTYRYDTGQYIYNWKTGTGGNYWQIGVKLDDGQIYYVNIGLR